VPWSSIKLHEVRQWLYWAIFNAPLPPLDQISHSRRVILDEALDLLEKRSGCQFEEGSNPAVPPILLTLDNVNIMGRPLTFYAIIWSINFFLKVWYETQKNVRFGSHDGLERVSLFSFQIWFLICRQVSHPCSKTMGSRRWPSTYRLFSRPRPRPSTI
jgi:hypothetical protein